MSIIYLRMAIIINNNIEKAFQSTKNQHQFMFLLFSPRKKTGKAYFSEASPDFIFLYTIYREITDPDNLFFCP